MRKILPILLALAMVLTLLPVSAFAVGTDRTEDLAALEEQMRQELFSADDRIYAEDYEAPELSSRSFAYGWFSHRIRTAGSLLQWRSR